MKRRVIQKYNDFTLTLPLTTTGKSVGLLSSVGRQNNGDVYVINDAITVDIKTVGNGHNIELFVYFNIIDYPFLKDNVIISIDWGDGFIDKQSVGVNIGNNVLKFNKTYDEFFEPNLYKIKIHSEYEWGVIGVIKTYSIKKQDDVISVVNMDTSFLYNKQIKSTFYDKQILNDIQKLSLTDEGYVTQVEIIQIDGCDDPLCVKKYLIQNNITGVFKQDNDGFHLIKDGIYYIYNIKTNLVTQILDYDELGELGIKNDLVLQIENMSQKITYQEPHQFGIDYPIDIQSNVFVERDKLMPLESFYKLSEVDNMVELENNGNGYFKIKTLGDLKI